MRGLIVLALLATFPSLAMAELHTESVEYRHGDTVLEGYLAYDPTLPAPRPGVLIVHEWKGLNDYAKRRAEQLAALGYVAFAADMYGKGILAKDHAEAGQLSGTFRQDRQLMRARATAALDVLRGHEQVDAARLAAIGYCFGGTTVLELARAGTDLRGVASFHGGLGAPTPAQTGGVTARVMVFHGADDTFISPEELAVFEAEMQSAGADYQIVQYPGAVHSFTVPDAGNDPSKGMAYNASADADSWQKLKAFLTEIFD